MKKYKCHKEVHASPMSRQDYNNNHVKNVPESAGDEGYVVVYDKGTKDQYTSWSPKKQFDKGYNLTVEDIGGSSMDFGEAIRRMKQGSLLARKGWNGKNMYVKYTEGTIYIDGNSEIVMDPHIDMVTAQGSIQVGWLASQADMDANDWVVVE